jgi:hypothetical protein
VAASRVDNPETDCARLIRDILNSAAKSTRSKLFSTNPLDILDRVNGEGKVRLRDQGPKGTIDFVKGKRVIYVQQQPYTADPRTEDNIQTNYANITLQETLHFARGKSFFDDIVLAQALWDVSSDTDRDRL